MTKKEKDCMDCIHYVNCILRKYTNYNNKICEAFERGDVKY